MKTNFNFSPLALNQSAAIVLAAAVTELFPGVQMIAGQGTGTYFFYDFVFPFSFQAELLTLIEERMRFVLKENRPVKLLEMMPLNAADLMRHKKQILASEILESVEAATLLICQLGDFVVYSPDYCPKQLVIPFFKLCEGVFLDKSTIRIIGAAGSDKGAVKEIFKKTAYSARSSAVLAQQAALVAPVEGVEGWIWRPRGERVRQAMINWWKAAAAKRGFTEVSMPVTWGESSTESALIQAHLSYFLSYKEPRVAQMGLFPLADSSLQKEGFFSAEPYFADRLYLFCTDQHFLEECISSLQFILQIPKILGFEFEVALSVSLEAPKSLRSQSVSLWEKAFEHLGIKWVSEKVQGTAFVSCVQLRFLDALGRKWATSFVGIPLEPMPVGKGRVLVASIWGSLERILALLLEKTEGWLPLMFTAEQVRLLVLAPAVKSYAQQIAERLNAEGIRVSYGLSQERLKAQLDQACLEKVPYLVLLGEKEQAGQFITIREAKTQTEYSLSLDMFCVKLKEAIASEQKSV